MDSEGIHVKGGQAISWPEVEFVTIYRATTGDLLFCIRPVETSEFIARAPIERQAEMRSNLDEYQVPLFINLSAFWQGSTEDLATRITALTFGSLTLSVDG